MQWCMAMHLIKGFFSNHLILSPQNYQANKRNVSQLCKFLHTQILKGCFKAILHAWVPGHEFDCGGLHWLPHALPPDFPSWFTQRWPTFWVLESPGLTRFLSVVCACIKAWPCIKWFYHPKITSSFSSKIAKLFQSGWPNFLSSSIPWYWKCPLRRLRMHSCFGMHLPVQYFRNHLILWPEISKSDSSREAKYLGSGITRYHKGPFRGTCMHGCMAMHP
jgi:hypothetical protein